VTRGDVLRALTSLAAVTLTTVVLRSWLALTSPTIAALLFLLIVLITAATSRLAVAVAASIVADLCLNYFFMPPFGTLTIADPENWVALFVFLAVSVIASNLSLAARMRTIERELKSALLASLAHDLRTPLTAIKVAASNLQATWLTDADRREQSDLVLAEVERLTRDLQSILEMARIDAGGVSTDVRWADPREILEAAQAQVEDTTRRHPIDVTIPGDVLVRLDPRLTSAAIARLLENAAQYSDAGGRIELAASVSGARLLVSVRDHGGGIAPDDLPLVFDPFYRGGSGRGRPSGMGMGLSIARGLVAAEGGRIRAENCADGGARFTIDVPVAVKPAAVQASEAPA
jgi:two-component system sensor histidine kinase KdpD